MKRKKAIEEPEAREGQKQPQAEPDCHKERIEAEVAGHKPGAAGLTARSTRSKC